MKNYQQKYSEYKDVFCEMYMCGEGVNCDYIHKQPKGTVSF